MKLKIINLKHYILFAISIPVICSAQISINQSDFVSVGKTFTICSNDTIFNLMPIGSGLQTWNFGSLVSSSEEVYEVQIPQWTPYASSYSNEANVALYHGGEYQFLNINNNSAVAVGQTTFNVNVKLNSVEKIMDFPSTLGSNFTTLTRYKAQIDTNISQALGTIDSLRIGGKRERKVKFDAYGSLTTPMGTFQSVRVKESIIQTDSIFAKLVTAFGSLWIPVPAGLGIPNPIVDTTTSYSWYANNLGFKLLSFNFDSLNNFSSNVQWLKSTPVESNISELNNSFTRIYPNPSNGNILIKNNSDDLKRMIVYSIDGKRLDDILITKEQSIYNIDNLESGIYLITLLNNKNEIVRTEKLTIISSK